MTTSYANNIGLIESLATYESEPFTQIRLVVTTPSSVDRIPPETRDIRHAPRVKSAPMCEVVPETMCHKRAVSHSGLNSIENCLLATFGLVGVALAEIVMTVLY